MHDRNSHKFRLLLLLLIPTLFVLVIIAAAQTTKVKGIIKARNGDIIVLQTDTEPALNVQLTDTTDVGQVQGMLKARNKKMSMAALIPGLAIEVEGTSNGPNEMIAQKIRFKGNDFQQAQAINAGMHENTEALQQQQAELHEQQAALTQQQAQLTEQQQKLAEHKALIEANTARFGQLDDYYIYDEVTVYFGNGKTALDPQYKAPLMALAQKASTVNGYMVEVKGYASTTGSAALNQQLSENRATNVVNFLQQQGQVPLTRMLAPGAMGETGDSKTGADQAEARKVVVRVLQNKAIAGVS